MSIQAAGSDPPSCGGPGEGWVAGGQCGSEGFHPNNTLLRPVCPGSASGPVTWLCLEDARCLLLPVGRGFLLTCSLTLPCFRHRSYLLHGPPPSLPPSVGEKACS